MKQIKKKKTLLKQELIFTLIKILEIKVKNKNKSGKVGKNKIRWKKKKKKKENKENKEKRLLIRTYRNKG